VREYKIVDKPNWQIEIEKFDEEQRRSNEQYYKNHTHIGGLYELEHLEGILRDNGSGRRKKVPRHIWD
jgi:hypothetical protein